MRSASVCSACKSCAGRGQKLSISMQNVRFAARIAETLEMCEKSYDLKSFASLTLGKPRA